MIISFFLWGFAILHCLFYFIWFDLQSWKMIINKRVDFTKEIEFQSILELELDIVWNRINLPNHRSKRDRLFFSANIPPFASIQSYWQIKQTVIPSQSFIKLKATKVKIKQSKRKTTPYITILKISCMFSKTTLPPFTVICCKWLMIALFFNENYLNSLQCIILYIPKLPLTVYINRLLFKCSS